MRKTYFREKNKYFKSCQNVIFSHIRHKKVDLKYISYFSKKI